MIYGSLCIRIWRLEKLSGGSESLTRTGGWTISDDAATGCQSTTALWMQAQRGQTRKVLFDAMQGDSEAAVALREEYAG